MRWNLVLWSIIAVWCGFWCFGPMWTYYLQERKRQRVCPKLAQPALQGCCQIIAGEPQEPFVAQEEKIENEPLKENVEGTVNCTDENLHDEQKGAATSSSMSTISLKETMLSDNKTSHEQLCGLGEQNSASEDTTINDSTEVMTSFSEPSSLTQSLIETISLSDSANDMMVETTVESLTDDDSTNDSQEHPGATDVSPRSLMMTDTTPITQTPNETPSTTEAIIDVVGSMDEVVVISNATDEPHTTVECSASFTDTTQLTQTPGEAPSTTEAIIDVVGSMDEVVVISNATDEPHTTVKCSASFTDTTPITQTPDEAPSTKSSFETPSSQEAITDMGEVMCSKGETMVTSGVTYEVLASVEDSASFTNSTSLTKSSVETASSTDTICNMKEVVSESPKQPSVIEDGDPGLLPVKRPLSFQPGNKDNQITLDCFCECNWCCECVLNRPHTITSASCLLEKEKDWKNDDFYFLLHGQSTKSNTKRHSKKRKMKNTASQNERTQQPAPPATYSACFPKPTKKTIEEKDRVNDEALLRQHASRCFFLTPDKKMKSYAGAIKKQSSLAISTHAQTPKSCSSATKGASSFSNNLQAQSSSIGPIVNPTNQKRKSYAMASKITSPASSSVRSKASSSSGRSNSNGKGKGKNNVHRAGTSNKTTATPKSSGKKWPRQPCKQEGTWKQRNEITHVSSYSAKSSTRPNHQTTRPISVVTERKPKTETNINTNSRSYSWQLKHGGEKRESSNTRRL